MASLPGMGAKRGWRGPQTFFSGWSELKSDFALSPLHVPFSSASKGTRERAQLRCKTICLPALSRHRPAARALQGIITAAPPSQLQTLPPPSGLPARLRAGLASSRWLLRLLWPLLSVAVAPGDPAALEFRRSLGLTSSGKVYCPHGIHIQPAPNSV